MVFRDEPSTTLTLGARVYTQDRSPLGWVREIRPRHFQVEPPQAVAYWLSTDCIDWTAEGVVLLRMDSEDLVGYRMECPDGADAADSPDVGGEH